MRNKSINIKRKSGKLKNFISNWKYLTKDNWIISTIKGYKIEFDEKPIQEKIPVPIKFNNKEKALIDKEIVDMLEKGAIKESFDESEQFISNIFLVKKKNGKFRPVINLKPLNQFISYHHFKQETLDLILKGISKNSFFTSLDLTDAYFSISIYESDRKYLKFIWNEKLYEFQCLPFGIASAPRVFTKILKVIFSHIRSMGIDSYFYIDDSLLQAENFDLAVQNTEKVKTFIESVGFDINIEKSVFIPTNRIIFLGYIIDSVLFKVFLPEEKVRKIIELSNKMLKAHKVSIRSLAQLTGLYSSAHYAVQYAHLFHRYLDLDKTQALHASNNNFNSFLNISVEGKSEIVWWLENVKTVNGRPIRNDSPSYYLHTDASLNGWGAVFHGKQTQGHWSLEEQCLHINILELKAIYFSIISLCCHIERTHICVKSDSSTAVNYINNQGGSVLPLLEITKQIWHWCIKNKVLLSAVHIPGKENIIPDNLSRNFNDTSEWKLNESVFNEVTKHFFIPDTDLFASRLNKQLNNFVSWFPDPDAYATDAFSFSWHKLYPYIFPPFSQISRVLQKIEDDQVSRAILIVPVWTTQLWYPKLLKALIDFPVKLPQLSNLLTLAHNNQSHTMNTRKMFLIACLVSGNISLIKVFQTKLQKSFLNLGESQPMFSMNTLGEAGFCGVIQDKLVPLLHL